MKGLLFDLGHVSDRAKANIQAAGLTDRCEVREGNFFESFPAGADAYLMRHIIHDWTDEQSIQILKNCRAVVPQHGRVLIVGPVVPAGNDPSNAKEHDIVMLIHPGGIERTEEEYGELFAAAGFELTGATPTASPVSVIEGRRCRLSGPSSSRFRHRDDEAAYLPAKPRLPIHTAVALPYTYHCLFPS